MVLGVQLQRGFGGVLRGISERLCFLNFMQMAKLKGDLKIHHRPTHRPSSGRKVWRVLRRAPASVSGVFKVKTAEPRT